MRIPCIGIDKRGVPAIRTASGCWPISPSFQARARGPKSFRSLFWYLCGYLELSEVRARIRSASSS